MGLHIYIKIAPFANATQNGLLPGEREREREGGATAETGAESFELRLYPVFNKLSSARRSRGVKARAKLCRYLSNFIASG